MELCHENQARSNIYIFQRREGGGDIAFHETGRKQDQQNDTEIDRQGKTTSRRPISHRTWKELLQNVKRSMRGVGITVIQRVVRKGELRTKVDWVAQNGFSHSRRDFT